MADNQTELLKQLYDMTDERMASMLTDEQKDAFKRLDPSERDYVEGLLFQIRMHEKDGFGLSADMVQEELRLFFEAGGDVAPPVKH